MRDLTRLYQLVRETGACEKERAPLLEPPGRYSIASSPEDKHAIREKLVLQRRGSAYYKDPNNQKRNVFRSKTKKAAQNDFSEWTFTKAERFHELDRQVRNGGSINLAQGILLENADDPLDVTQAYTFDDKGNAMPTGQANGWLDIVAARNDVAYVRLLCAFGASQESKDQALNIAIEHGAMDAVQELFRNHANPNVSGMDHFFNAVATENTRLLQLFLTAIKPVAPEQMCHALIIAADRSGVDSVASLLAHGATADYNSGQALCLAITKERLEHVATILLYAGDTIGQSALLAASTATCNIENEESRHTLLELLLNAGAEVNTNVLQTQVIRAVETSNHQLVELLIGHGTSPDSNHAESLRLAITTGQVDLVPVLLQGHVSQLSASRVLDEAAALKDNDHYELVLLALLEKDVHKASLDKTLAEVVKRRMHNTLATKVIELGASSDFDAALCVRTALQRNDLNLFTLLLKAPSEPTILVKALPVAMNLRSRSDCAQAVRLLLQKKVSGNELHVALQTISTKASVQTDYQLMDLLIKSHASVDFLDANGNCICVAAAKSDEKALDLLIEGEPSADTVSEAMRNLPISLTSSEAAEYEKYVRIVRMLLEKGATGDSVAAKLVLAVRDDKRAKILDMLLQYSADVNYSDGAAIAEALKLPDLSALQKLCQQSTLSSETLALHLPDALKPPSCDLRKAKVLVETARSRGYQSILGAPLLQEITHNGSRSEVLALLVRCGADPNYQHGEVLRQAVAKGDVATMRLFLSTNPLKTSIARAIPTAMQTENLSVRYDMMQELMAKGDSEMGHEALVQAAHDSSPEDLSHVELLLQYGSSPDFHDGAAVLEAVKAVNLPLLKLFLAQSLSPRTLSNAFQLTVHQRCLAAERLQMYKILFTSSFRGYETSQALVETLRHSAFDVETCKLLLQHGASVDYQSGAALQMVAVAVSIELLGIFISAGPAQKSRDEAFIATVRADLDPESRLSIFTPLLDAKVSDHLVSWALLVASRDRYMDHSLVALLISSGASLDYEDGRALQSIVATGDVELVDTTLKGSVTRQTTLGSAFEAAMIQEQGTRYAITRQILATDPGVHRDLLSRRLSWVVREKDIDLMRLLISHDSDVAFDNGDCLITAARLGEAELTEILLSKAVPVAILNTAFEAMLEDRTIQNTPEGLQTAALILPFGIDQVLLDQALLDAFDDPVTVLTSNIVDLLSSYEPDFAGAQGKVFVLAACSNELEIFEKMAAHRPNLNVVIPSLIQCFEGIIEDQHPEVTGHVFEGDEMSKSLHEGDHSEDPSKSSIVNSQLVEDHVETVMKPLQPTVEDDDVSEQNSACEDENPDGYDLDEHEIVGEPSSGDESANPVTPKASVTGLTTEERLIHYLDLLFDHADRSQDLEDAVLFKAMECFPEGKQLVHYLLDHGCSPNSKTHDAPLDACCVLFKYERAFQAEQMNAVTWALSRSEPVIGEQVILDLLSAPQNVDVSFSTSQLKISAITIASASGRDIVVQRLIDLGADNSALDKLGHSPLFYASLNGHLTTARILTDAQAKGDDGSLHEAAREANPEIVKLLLASGHHMDFPSAVHADAQAGRTALEELCLNAAPGDDLDVWNEQITSCISQLLPTTIENEHSGITMLHLALSNKAPVPITRALLEFPEVWKHINDPCYLFRDGQGYFYSLTKYVEVFCDSSSMSTKQELLVLLKARKCLDRFYAHTVEQPPGAEGLPQQIAAAVENEMRARHDHQEALQRQTELATRHRAIEAEDHRRRTTEDAQRHENLRRQQADREEAEAVASRRKQEREQKHAQDIQRSRQLGIAEENRLRTQGLAEEASRRDAMRHSEHASELSHKQRVAAQEQQALQQRLAIEQQLISAREHAGQAEASRLANMLNQRQTTAKYEADQRIRAANAANHY